MDVDLDLEGEGVAHSLEGHFLIAMPNISDEPFARTVIYLCAHSPNGAMGFIINKAQPVSFPALLTQIGVVETEDDIRLPEGGREVSVCMGGPVEKGRGFVLHSDDYDSESTVPVAEKISLTPTIDILKALSEGVGPRTAIMALGYSGWAPGQLESEIAANGWLTCKADLGIVFDADLDNKYSRALGLLGIEPAFLAGEAGHA
ncbi:YqgE/AlgH family protein [Aurantimonas sp. VKM B-3413]|uniref:YqgE/AlgH family protein n=1 Tax=Aurantimonas sp. VKM B-3413 TaxID=2779401 RepID=UPI001E4159EB|nr:YqgE/AlgH family protein [Aurantimonas sp. VKM B-3413]MCB8839162.1 YqgE/AlgH family protein [Aurantimonas sp. VKM B-3413]